MRKLHRQLQAAFPQIDRVCWTTVSDKTLTVERAGQVAEVLKVCRGAGTKSEAYGLKLVDIAKSDQPVMLERIHRIQAPDMEYMGVICRSSFHIPIKIAGKHGSINFWSRDHKGFPKTAQEDLTQLVEKAMNR